MPPPAAEKLLARLDESARAFHSLKGIARVRVEGPQDSFKGTQVLLAEKPDRLRAETLSPFGQPVLLMATDGETLSVLAPTRGEYYRGVPSTRNLQRLTRLPLRLEDLVRIVLYQVPRIPHQKQDVSVLENGRIRLSLSADHLRQDLEFDRQLRLVSTDIYRDDEPQLGIRYDDFRDASHPFPRVTRLLMPRHETEAELEFSEVETNVDLSSDRFSLEAPEGVEVKPIP